MSMQDRLENEIGRMRICHRFFMGGLCGVCQSVGIILLMLALIFRFCVSEELGTIDIPSARLHLLKQYTIHSSEIYSTDIFPFLEKRFKLASLPPDRFTLKLKSVDLKLIFARYGYEVISFDSDIVEFVYAVDMKEQDGMEFLKKMYVQHYGKNLQIERILLRPLTPLPAEYQTINFELPPQALKRNKGTLIMQYKSLNNPQVKKASLIYEIQAQLKVLKSTRVINTNEIIDAHNTSVDTIVFERVWAEYIDTNELGRSGAKSYIRADLPITKDKIKARIVVKKGENIRVSSSEGGIALEVVLIAKQNGAYNEVINAQNPSSGKILRVRVIDDGRGEIL